MFDPAKKGEQAEKKKLLDALSKRIYARIVPPFQEHLIVSCKEVICGDPNCSPVDTVVTMLWTAGPGSGGRGLWGFPTTVEKIDDELLDFFIPDVDHLAQWQQGVQAFWNPMKKRRRKNKSCCTHVTGYLLWLGSFFGLVVKGGETR